MDNDTAAHLRQAIQRCTLTRRELQRQTGVSHNTVKKFLETGDIRSDAAARLLAYFGWPEPKPPATIETVLDRIEDLAGRLGRIEGIMDDHGSRLLRLEVQADQDGH